MLTIAIFTYKRLANLNNCLKSLDSKNISEIIIFNDDEKKELYLTDLLLKKSLKNMIKIYNPIDFGFSDRNFRKPFYINKAFEISKNELLLLSDDDGVFNPGAIDSHYNALAKYPFCAGGIIRSKLFNKISKSILQGTNYAFRKSFFYNVGKYDENYIKSMGGGDVDFWYRIYNYSIKNNINVVFLPNAIQKVTSAKSTRKKTLKSLDPKNYTMKKHDLDLSKSMYKWFKNIRDKYKWMDILD